MQRDYLINKRQTGASSQPMPTSSLFMTLHDSEAGGGVFTPQPTLAICCQAWQDRNLQLYQAFQLSRWA